MGEAAESTAGGAMEHEPNSGVLMLELVGRRDGFAGLFPRVRQAMRIGLIPIKNTNKNKRLELKFLRFTPMMTAFRHG